MFSPIGSDMNRPVVNWVEGYAQLGYMMTKIRGTNFLDGALRGNLELSGELFGAGIYEETGHYIAGGTIWLGYNLVPQNSRWLAYARAGLGGEFMDINHMYDGHNFNFNVDAAAGLHYFIKLDRFVERGVSVPAFVKCGHGGPEHWSQRHGPDGRNFLVLSLSLG